VSLGNIVTRVLIVDDRPSARHSLQALLTAIHWSSNVRSEPGDGLIETVGEASDGQGAIDQVELLRPDVVVMEMHMPELDGPTTIRIIKNRWPEIRIVVLTMYAKDRAAALEAGADVFLLKGCSTGELLAALMPRS
jgi:DNA-binding NarL/FixJ family response regulator